ncbi:MAG: haloacid dehalogenase-like hydrolase [Deltaproteobacteria bacterium]|nr:haloacid dehalogenase-like hydrolase [Deltaproteobacteria bacterium]
MMRKMSSISAGVLAIFILFSTLFGCAGLCPSSLKDPLPSWKDGEKKRGIIGFVEAVTDPSKASHLPPGERIAVFDNDGTLMCEEPLSVPEAFIFHSVVGLLEKHPEMGNRRPFKALREKDSHAIEKLSERELGELTLAPFVGVTQDTYIREAGAFLRESRHPRFKVPYTATAYRPMVELLDYLLSRGFTVYIVSGGLTGLIRAFSQEMYGIPAENVIGTTAMLRYGKHEGKSVLVRAPSFVMPINDGEGKAVNIWLRIGKRPVIAVGNSDGDLPMLEFTADRNGPHLLLLVHHDDEKREYCYDRGAEKVLEEARKRDWNIVSIKEDFVRVFPFQEK